MSKHYVSRFAICPYYKYETPGKVVCDGKRKYSIHVSFDNRTYAKDHKNKYCRCKFNWCQIYLMLDKGFEISNEYCEIAKEGIKNYDR